MMRRRILICLLVVLMLVLILPGAAALAQTSGGSIRGSVYHDQDANGVCVGTGEPGQPGVPVEFAIQDGQLILELETGVDGSYGLVAVGLGRYLVSAKPGTGWQVTSQQVLDVTLTAEQPVATGVDFCIAQVPDTGGTPPPPPPPATLPESGASVSPNLIIATAIGAFLLAMGSALLLRSRRNPG